MSENGSTASGPARRPAGPAASGSGRTPREASPPEPAEDALSDRADVVHQTWTIAELADEYHVTHRTIRFYEDRGLVTPEREGTRRIFHARDRVRLGLVLRGKRLGFDLGQIRRIVDMYDDSPGEEGQLRYLLEQIEARRADLEQRQRDIAVTLAELEAVEYRCRQALGAPK